MRQNCFRSSTPTGRTPRAPSSSCGPARCWSRRSAIDRPAFAALAKQIAAREHYLPLIVVDPETALPDNAIPFAHSDDHPERLLARLNSALRVRSLHATVMRRLDPPRRMAISDIDPARDATVLLIGRGGAYPALSVALGERMGVVGALSIEAAAKHLNTRDIDGIVLGEGFTPRVVDAFLTVLTEDARFRNLPVIVTAGSVQQDLRTCQSRDRCRRSRPRRRLDTADAASARLRGASEPDAAVDRCRRA